MSTVDEYKAAMNELAAATASFKPIATFMKSLNAVAAYNATGFLQANYGLRSMHGGRGTSDRNRFDMSTWPSRDQVDAASTRLAAAFNQVHKIYDQLASDDREYVKSPPHQPDVDAR